MIHTSNRLLFRRAETGESLASRPSPAYAYPSDFNHMKPLLDVIARPHNFALLMAVAVGTFIHQAGALSIPAASRSAEREIKALGMDVAHTFLFSRRAGRRQQTAQLEKALDRAIRHPWVGSASIRLPSSEVLASVRKAGVDPAFAGREMALPIVDPAARLVATVIFEVSGAAAEPILMGRQIWAFTIAGAGLCFFSSLTLLRRRERFLPELLNALKKVTAGNFDIALPAPTTVEHAEVVRAFNRMVEGLQERDRMRHSLGRIMDPKIAEILIKENPKVGGLRRQATILFCDIRNYTSICEELSPDELQTFLNEYWKDTVEIIMEQEGTIDKFHGDGVCVVFGAPVLHEDDPLRAVRTAWRLVRNVDLINERRAAQRKMPIQIGVSIHTGEVIAGHIGSERRMDYTVVGDAVNVAARIEELNKKFGTNILISDNVYEKVESHVRVKTLTLAYLRGHKRPILIHALREFLETADALPQQKAA